MTGPISLDVPFGAKLRSSAPPTIADYPIIIACEVGGCFQIGWHDSALGPFESREFAAAVAAKPLSPPYRSK
jgi:hypothetical protein